MPPRLKLLLDENISSPRGLKLIQQGLALGEDPSSVEVQFLKDFTEQEGLHDSEWIPRAVQSGYGGVITTDQGRKKRGDKLPEICLKEGLPHVLVSQGLKARGLKWLTLSLVCLLTNIETALADKRTLRFKLRLVKLKGQKEVGDYRLGLYRAQ